MKEVLRARDWGQVIHNQPLLNFLIISYNFGSCKALIYHRKIWPKARDWGA
jgi:hypothetical protein